MRWNTDFLMDTQATRLFKASLGWLDTKMSVALTVSCTNMKHAHALAHLIYVTLTGCSFGHRVFNEDGPLLPLYGCVPCSLITSRMMAAERLLLLLLLLSVLLLLLLLSFLLLLLLLLGRESELRHGLQQLSGWVFSEAYMAMPKSASLMAP